MTNAFQTSIGTKFCVQCMMDDTLRRFMLSLNKPNKQASWNVLGNDT